MTTTQAIQKLIRILQNQDINFDQQTDTLTECIGDAVDKYSGDKPVVDKVDLIGNGTQTIDFPATFTYDFSKIESVEYPIGNVPPTILDSSDYGIYRKADDTLQLKLYETTPTSGDSIPVEYTQYVEVISDVLAHDEKAVLQLAAYYAATRESQKAANTTSDGDALDFVDHVTTSARYESLSVIFKKNYDNHIFGDPDAAKAAGDSVAASETDEWSTESRWNEPRIFHVDDE